MIEYVWAVDKRKDKSAVRKLEVLNVKASDPNASCGENRAETWLPEHLYTTEDEAKKACYEANKPKVGEKVRVRIGEPSNVSNPNEQKFLRIDALHSRTPVEGIVVQYRADIAIVWWAEATTPLYCFLDEIEAVR